MLSDYIVIALPNTSTKKFEYKLGSLGFGWHYLGKLCSCLTFNIAKLIKPVPNETQRFQFVLIKQKGMTFDHEFCYSFSFSSSLFFLGGKRKGEKNKVVVKSHAFLLDHLCCA